MGKVKSIMAACDFSEYAPQVVSYAANLTKRLNSKLFVVNIINERDVYIVRKIASEFPSYSVDKFIEKQKEDRLKMMDDMILELGGNNLDVEKIIRVGVPFKELIQVSEDEKVDMLVMGTRGRGNIAGALFGSTAEKVFRRCPVPLLSIRTVGK